MNKLVLILSGGALATVSLASAQTVYRPLPQASVQARTYAPDPLAVLQSRLTRLEHQVNALQSTISKTQPSLTFMCVDNTTSRNSVGVSEDCAPYACAPIDGRCRTTARTSGDCAPGKNWIEGGGCI
jgi:hypothetical protein